MNIDTYGTVVFTLKTSAVPPLPSFLAALVYIVSNNLFKKYFLFVPIIRLEYMKNTIQFGTHRIRWMKVNKNKEIFILDKKRL
jgi:hypothetical protein